MTYFGRLNVSFHAKPLLQLHNPVTADGRLSFMVLSKNVMHYTYGAKEFKSFSHLSQYVWHLFWAADRKLA